MHLFHINVVPTVYTASQSSGNVWTRTVLLCCALKLVQVFHFAVIVLWLSDREPPEPKRSSKTEVSSARQVDMHLHTGRAKSHIHHIRKNIMHLITWVIVAHFHHTNWKHFHKPSQTSPKAPHGWIHCYNVGKQDALVKRRYVRAPVYYHYVKKENRLGASGLA